MGNAPGYQGSEMEGEDSILTDAWSGQKSPSVRSMLCNAGNTTINTPHIFFLLGIT